MVLLVAAGAYIYIYSQPKTVTSDCVLSNGLEATITYTEQHTFSPSCVIISSVSKVLWVNKSAGNLDIGADPHPIHTGNREVSGGKFVLNIAPNQTSEVTLTKTGSFGYHNHLRPWDTGTIVVK